MKNIWNKYNLLFFIIVLVWCLYSTFLPKDVKIVKTEHIKTIENKEEIYKLKKEISILEKQLTETKKNINIVETIKEIRHPDNTVEIITERTIIDKSEIKVENINSSSSTVTLNTVTTSSTQQEIQTTLTQIINKPKFWTTGFGYNYFNKQIELSHGINFFNITLLISGIYSIDSNNFDIGGKVLLKY